MTTEHDDSRSRNRLLLPAFMILLLFLFSWWSSRMQVQAYRQPDKDKFYTAPEEAKDQLWNIGRNGFTAKGIPLARDNSRIQASSGWMDYGENAFEFELTPSEETAYYPFIQPYGNELTNLTREQLQGLYGDHADAWFMAYPVNTIVHDSPVDIYSGVALLPTHENGFLNHCGVWVRNFGKYQGKAVDCKCTFIFEAMIGNNAVWDPEEADRSRIVYPVILFYARKDGTFGVDGGDANFEVRFQLYEHESVNGVFTEADTAGVPGQDRLGNVVIDQVPSAAKLPVNLCLGVGDIDDAQSVGVWGRNGTHDRIEVSGNSQLYCIPASSRVENAENIMLTAWTGYHWVGSPRGWNAVDGNAEGECRFYLENCSDFDIFFGGWLKINKTGATDNRYNVGEDEKTQDFEDCLIRYKTALQQITQEHRFDPGSFPNSTAGTGEHNLQRASFYYLTSHPFSQYRLPLPSMAVADDDEPVAGQEKEARCNTLKNAEETFVYHIEQRIPAERSEFFYESFTVTDAFPKEADCDAAGVLVTDAAGNDVSGRFRWNLQGRVLKIEAVRGRDGNAGAAGGSKSETATGKGILSDPDFYGETYYFHIPCHLSPESTKEPGEILVENYATVTVDTVFGGERARQTADTRMNQNITVAEGTARERDGDGSVALTVTRAGAVNPTGEDRLVRTTYANSFTYLEPMIRITAALKDGIKTERDLPVVYEIRRKGSRRLIYTTVVTIPKGSTQGSAVVRIKGGSGTEDVTYEVCQQNSSILELERGWKTVQVHRVVAVDRAEPDTGRVQFQVVRRRTSRLGFAAAKVNRIRFN